MALFTRVFTNADSPITLTRASGYTKYNIFNRTTSTAAVTILGTGTLNNYLPSAIDVNPGESETITGLSDEFISVVITIPAGAVMQMTAGNN